MPVIRCRLIVSCPGRVRQIGLWRAAQRPRLDRAKPDNLIYGLHVWLCARDGAWRMDGIYGQFGIVLPGHRACVSVTAHYLGPTTHILDSVWEHIVPALG